MKRVTINGFDRYSTDGVSVYRGKAKQKVYKDGYHLVQSGSTQFVLVSVELALAAGVKVDVKPEVEVKPKATRKRKSKKSVD